MSTLTGMGHVVEKGRQVRVLFRYSSRESQMLLWASARGGAGPTTSRVWEFEAWKLPLQHLPLYWWVEMPRLQHSSVSLEYLLAVRRCHGIRAPWEGAEVTSGASCGVWW